MQGTLGRGGMQGGGKPRPYYTRMDGYGALGVVGNLQLVWTYT